MALPGTASTLNNLTAQLMRDKPPSRRGAGGVWTEAPNSKVSFGAQPARSAKPDNITTLDEAERVTPTRDD
jgi:hypothetical protein